MIGIFKQKNPGNTLILFIYALLLKFPALLHPSLPSRQEEDRYLYNWLVNFLHPLNMPAAVYAFLAFVLLFIQALLFNRIFSEQKMLAKPNYLAGMSYILITSLLPEWSQFSSPLIINTFLIWIFYRMIMLHNSNTPGYHIFNIGLLMGIVTLLYEPAIVFVLLIFFTLFIMRPFRIREWLIAIVGVTTPYYFLAVILFLSDAFRWNRIIPQLIFDVPAMPSSIFITVSIALLVIPFIIGGYFVQSNLNKTYIQVRKSWSLLLLFLIISMLIIVVNGGDRYVNWLTCVVPLAGFHAAAYYYPEKKSVPLILHWIIFGYAVFMNYSMVV